MDNDIHPQDVTDALCNTLMHVLQLRGGMIWQLAGGTALWTGNHMQRVETVAVHSKIAVEPNFMD
jgi:hypothetical protein